MIVKYTKKLSMNKNIYVILSPGRTGSHIILEMLTGGPGEPRPIGGLANAVGYWYPLDIGKLKIFSGNENLVIHAHETNVISKLNLDPAQITLILSYRKDLFLQAMSLKVAEITDEWSGKNYTNKTPEPQQFDKNEFLNSIKSIQQWPDRLDLSLPYKKVVRVYYEDIVEHGLLHVADLLNLEYNESACGKIFQKSPHSYKDWISNWEKLYQEYLKVSVQ
jgi:LPS sulfotransferase NodH